MKHITHIQHRSVFARDQQMNLSSQRSVDMYPPALKHIKTCTSILAVLYFHYEYSCLVGVATDSTDLKYRTSLSRLLILGHN